MRLFSLWLRGFVLSSLFTIVGFILPCSQVFADGNFQDYQGGMQIFVEQWPPGTHGEKRFSSTYENDTVIQYMMNKSWDQVSDSICSWIINQLGKPGAVMNGQTLYDWKCSMGDSTGTSLKIEDNLSQGIVKLLYHVPGNYLEFTSTQPYVGKWGDPRFSVNYDLDLEMEIGLNSPPGISVSKGTAYVRNSRIDSHNVVADIALTFINSMKSLFGSALPQVETMINSRQIDVTGFLQKQIQTVNNLILKGYADQGYSDMEGKFVDGKVSLYMGGKTFKVWTTGPGTVSGSIRWKKTDGVPQDGMSACHSLAVQATVPDGYREAGQLFGPTASAGNLKMDYLYTPIGDQYQCGYTLVNLPVNVPITLSVVAVGPWITPGKIPVSPRWQADGWAGTITLYTPQAGMHFNVASGSATNSSAAKGVIELNPQPLPPRVQQNQSNTNQTGKTIPMRGLLIRPFRNNPTGYPPMDGIDFVLNFQQIH